MTSLEKAHQDLEWATKKRKRMSAELEPLDSEFQERQKKLKILRSSLAQEAGVAVRYQLEAQINNEANECQKLIAKIETIEKAYQELGDEVKQIEVEIEALVQRRDREHLNNYRSNHSEIPLGVASLSKAIMKLNYTIHTKEFARITDKKPACAILLPGSPELEVFDGLDLLVRRLQKRICRSEQKFYRIKLELSKHRLDVETFWSQVKRTVAPSESYSTLKREDIGRYVGKQLETMHVGLMLADLDRMAPEDLRAFMTEFWHPLVQGACQTNQSGKLLLFLVDYTNRFLEVEIEELFKLPRVEHFSYEVLFDWYENQSEFLEPWLKSEDPIQEIWQHTDEGSPDKVLWYLCKKCECGDVFTFLEGIN